MTCSPILCSCWHPRHYPWGPSQSRPGLVFSASHRALSFPALCFGPVDTRPLGPTPALALRTGPVWAWSLTASSGHHSQQNRLSRIPKQTRYLKEPREPAGHSGVSSHGTEHGRAHPPPQRAVWWQHPRWRQACKMVVKWYVYSIYTGRCRANLFWLKKSGNQTKSNVCVILLMTQSILFDIFCVHKDTKKCIWVKINTAKTLSFTIFGRFPQSAHIPE